MTQGGVSGGEGGGRRIRGLMASAKMMAQRREPRPHGGGGRGKIDAMVDTIDIEEPRGQGGPDIRRAGGGEVRNRASANYQRSRGRGNRNGGGA